MFVVGLLLLILTVSFFAFLYSLLFGYSCVFSIPSSCCSYFGNVHVGNHFRQFFLSSSTSILWKARFGLLVILTVAGLAVILIMGLNWWRNGGWIMIFFLPNKPIKCFLQILLYRFQINQNLHQVPQKSNSAKLATSHGLHRTGWHRIWWQHAWRKRPRPGKEKFQDTGMSPKKLGKRITTYL